MKNVRIGATKTKQKNNRQNWGELVSQQHICIFILVAFTP
jgi:hypothetical protein